MPFTDSILAKVLVFQKCLKVDGSLLNIKAYKNEYNFRNKI